MLPFLKMQRKQDGIATEYRKTDESDKKDQEDHSDGLEACAQDMLKAFHEGDAKNLSKALEAAFDILDSRPHVEGPHLNEDESEE